MVAFKVLNMARAPLLVLASSLMLSSQAMAADDGWDFSKPFVEKCYEDVTAGQLGNNVCINKELRRRDATMNELYKKLIADLTEPEAKMLRESQRAWLKFRDLECALRTSGMDGGGSATPFFSDSCLLDLTVKRIKDLEHIGANLDCTGCPVRKHQ